VPTQLGQHDLLVPSEISVEMQTVSVGISNVELTRAPRSVTDLSPVEIGASDRELFEEFIDVRNNESVRWSIALAEVLGLVPLKVKFHTVTPHAGVFRFDGRVPEGRLKAKQLIELYGRGDVANHQYRLNRLQLRHHIALSESKPSAQREKDQPPLARASVNWNGCVFLS
jgi:hypothetical protein